VDLFVEVHDAEHGHPQFFGEFLEWAENCTHVSGAEAVDLADSKIGGNWIDDDHHDLTDLDYLLSQRSKVGDQAKHPLLVRLAHDLEDRYAPKVSAGGDQPRYDRVAVVVFGGQHDHIAERCVPFITRP